MVRIRQVPKTRLGYFKGMMISDLCHLPIIAMVAVILSNIPLAVSFRSILSRNRSGSRTCQEIFFRNAFSSATKSKTPTSSKTSSLRMTWSVNNHFTRQEAQLLLDGPQFLPSMKYGDRVVFGRQAAEKEYGESEEIRGVMLSDDPRLARTYAEFPLESLDLLLDQACFYLPGDIATVGSSLNMVDIGSGLGRIVLYSALTRPIDGAGVNKANWSICGIEISPSLHEKALELVQTGVDVGIFEKTLIEESKNINSFSFLCGSVTDKAGRRLLEDAHLVFAYSTAFKAKEFDPNVGALILDTEEWSLPLSEACSDGCVVITTDRALNPNLGWNMVERIDVPNPEVLGTTAFIHVLEKGRVTPP